MTARPRRGLRVHLDVLYDRWRGPTPRDVEKHVERSLTAFFEDLVFCFPDGMDGPFVIRNLIHDHWHEIRHVRSPPFHMEPPDPIECQLICDELNAENHPGMKEYLGLSDQEEDERRTEILQTIVAYATYDRAWTHVWSKKVPADEVPPPPGFVPFAQMLPSEQAEMRRIEQLHAGHAAWVAANPSHVKTLLMPPHPAVASTDWVPSRDQPFDPGNHLPPPVPPVPPGMRRIVVVTQEQWPYYADVPEADAPPIQEDWKDGIWTKDEKRSPRESIRPYLESIDRRDLLDKFWDGQNYDPSNPAIRPVAALPPGSDWLTEAHKHDDLQDPTWKRLWEEKHGPATKGAALDPSADVQADRPDDRIDDVEAGARPPPLRPQES